MKNRLIFKLLTLLGFGAVLGGCDLIGDIIDNGHVAEYGCPTASYEVKGKVTDADIVPIEGIKVVMKVVDSYDDQEYLHRVDSMQTDATGQYVLKTYDLPTDTRELRIEASDTDGSENGGQFASTEKSVVFDASELSGSDGHWYFGSATKTLDITLEKEEE